MNYVDLAVAQSAVLQRIGDKKTDSADAAVLAGVYERLVAVERTPRWKLPLG